jgi:hypothetical protein
MLGRNMQSIGAMGDNHFVRSNFQSDAPNRLAILIVHIRTIFSTGRNEADRIRDFGSPYDRLICRITVCAVSVPLI